MSIYRRIHVVVYEAQGLQWADERRWLPATNATVTCFDSCVTRSVNASVSPNTSVDNRNECANEGLAPSARVAGELVDHRTSRGWFAMALPRL